ncbi:hypothetical protein [Pseudogulbenkiania subflava]|uniref:Nickel transport protein n=1 Tax=Pseudogulbenkiania subflava DSM 22618 TaxID=1123014 RepID=A0A1Y6BEQ2_9NEIS|nr:hypothetical protein [Pseudogulbenkiania subflava]SMF03610.1 hypothetical protein SAMN02745746_00886 [Pseudogulbenkiania subflava DSM 22618]
MIRQTLLFTLLFAPVLVFAHGGEDHGDGAKPAVSANVAPRAEAHTELFELLVTPAGGQLTVYLDRYASNEPVTGAKVEIESGSWKTVAQAAEDGSYRAKAPQFAKPGQYPLVLTVQAGADTDLIETTLVVAEPTKPVAAVTSHGSGTMWWWVGGALVALGAVSVLLKRRTTRHTA